MNERVGNRQRSEVLDLLNRAVSEGYLDLTEYEQRLGVASAAKTAEELMSQLVDLPPQFQWHPRRPPTVTSEPIPTTGKDTRTTSIASLVLAIVSIPLAICFGIGGLFGIAAIVLSRPGLRGSTDYGKSLAGLVVGGLGILLSIVMLLLFIFLPDSPKPSPTAP